jgi:hypothetical protein
MGRWPEGLEEPNRSPASKSGRGPAGSAGALASGVDGEVEEEALLLVVAVL